MIKVVIDTSVFVAAMLRPTRQSSPRQILSYGVRDALV